MKKLLKIGVVLLLLAVIAVVAVGFLLGPIVKKAVNTVGPRVTGTKVELDAAKILPLTGSGTLAGLYVGNPDGWESDKAFYLGEVRAGIRPLSLLSDHLEITEVYIDAPQFVYEYRLLGGSNLDALLAQIDKNIGGGGETTPSAPAEAPSGEPMKFSIKSLVLQNAEVTVIAAGRTLKLTLPAFTITDLGVAEGGITAEEASRQILRRVVGQIAKVAGEAVVEAGGAMLQDGKSGGQATKDAAKSALNKLLGK